MTSINRVRVGWSGFRGGDGVSTFYLDAGVTDLSPLKTFLTSMATNIPSLVTLTLPNSGDQIDDTTGQITNVWAASNGGSIACSGGSAAYSGSSGFCVDWLSGTIIAGRRRMGRTFFVPGSVSVYQQDGSIIESVRTSVLAATTTLLTALSGKFLIWSRPFPGSPGSAGPPAIPAKPARSGLAVPAIGARVPDIAAVLRSRRD